MSYSLYKTSVDIAKGAVSWDNLFQVVEGFYANVSADVEYRWDRSGKPVYYVEGGLLDKIERLGLDVQTSDLPFGVWAFSTGKLPPWLFSVCTHPDPGSHHLSVMSSAEHFRISIVSRLKLYKAHRAFTDADEVSVLTGKDIVEMLQYSSDGLIESCLWESPLETGEDQELRRMLKISLGLILYMKAFPGSVREGFPEIMKLRERRYARNAGHKRVHVVSDWLLGVSPHRRCGHLRVLRDARFLRLPDGSARVIWVKEAIVKRHEVKPTTVKE